MNSGSASNPFTLSGILGFQYACGSILLISLAQLLIKFATSKNPEFDFAIIYDQHFLLSILSAGVAYLISIFLWIKTLSLLPLSVAYPLLSLSYPIVYLAAATSYYFNEAISTQRNIGVALIVVGVLLGSKK